MTQFELHRPQGVSAAVALANELGSAASYIAGGSDLMVQINRRRRVPTHLIALQGVADLSGIEWRADRVALGALTTMKAIERHPGFAVPALCAVREAAQVVGGHQVRNVATVGGNIVNASPAADLVPTLLTFDADIVLTGSAGDRHLPLVDFLRGPGQTARRSGELLRRIIFAPPPMGTASAFLKAGRRRAMEISVVCVAAAMHLDDRGSCRDVRIALGAVGPTALRAREAERLLHGAHPSAEVFRAAGEAAAAASTPIDDVRASAWYRRRVVAAMVARALQRCCERIGAASE